MQKKISLLVGIITALSGFISVWQCDKIFKGLKFNAPYLCLIFTILSFISLSILLKTRKDCLLIDNNIIRFARIANRKKTTFIELSKITLTVLAVEVTEILSIALFSMILGKETKISNLLLLFICGFLIKLFLMTAQFITELFITYDLAFVIISTLYAACIFAGDGIKRFIEESPQAPISGFLNTINKLIIVNYISPARASALSVNIYIPIAVTAILIIFEFLFCFIKIKKYDILPKE